MSEDWKQPMPSWINSVGVGVEHGGRLGWRVEPLHAYCERTGDVLEQIWFGALPMSDEGDALKFVIGFPRSFLAGVGGQLVREAVETLIRGARAAQEGES